MRLLLNMKINKNKVFVFIKLALLALVFGGVARVNADEMTEQCFRNLQNLAADLKRLNEVLDSPESSEKNKALQDIILRINFFKNNADCTKNLKIEELERLIKEIEKNPPLISLSPKMGMPELPSIDIPKAGGVFEKRQPDLDLEKRQQEINAMIDRMNHDIQIRQRQVDNIRRVIEAQ